MLSWFHNKAVRPKLPPNWTPDLWDELASKGNRGFDLQCYVGIENLSIKFDFNAHHGEKFDSVKVQRSAGGFIGAQPGTRLALLRAVLSFVAHPENDQNFSRLPKDSAGWGQTFNGGGGVPSLHFTLFISVENQRVFEESFVRAKMLHIDHVEMSIWAKSLEPWWDEEDEKNVFARVFNIQRVIFGQHLHLHGWEKWRARNSD